MILSALKEYYERLASEPDSGIPRFGYSREKIGWCIVIDREGNVVEVRSLENPDQKGKTRPREMLVPQRIKKSVNIAANFLWGDTASVFGASAKTYKDTDRPVRDFHTFREKLISIGGEIDDDGMMAVIAFSEKWNPDNALSLDSWEKIIDSTVVFLLDGDTVFLHDRPHIIEAYMRFYGSHDAKKNGRCIISGDRAAIARLHPAIHGVKGAQSSGANIVSFNLDAFCSYGKEQGYNAPVGEYAAFAYTTALNWLLRSGSPQKIQIADATTVFWAERPSLMEQSFFAIFDPPREEKTEEPVGTVDDRASASQLQVYLDALRQGKRHEFEAEKDVRFYILGLSPNAARISVRFWHVSTVADIAEKIGRHFRDMAIEKGKNTGSDFPAMWQLLRETAVQNDSRNISPLLGGAFMRSILTGGKYPESLLSSVIMRIRAGQDITYFRALLIKGCLVRNHGMEVTPMLDKENKEAAYLLGRLFAIFEWAQEDASRGTLNSTIRDRYFSSASATPRAVFPLLIRLNQHHTSKGDHGGYFQKLIGDIIEELPAEKFPAHLTLEDQGLFAIGYYHQRNARFKKQDKSQATVTTDTVSQ